MVYNSLILSYMDQRGKVVHKREMRVWGLLTKDCMSDESDNKDRTKTRHTPKWRSEHRSHGSCVIVLLMFYTGLNA